MNGRSKGKIYTQWRKKKKGRESKRKTIQNLDVEKYHVPTTKLAHKPLVLALWKLRLQLKIFAMKTR
jgi:hypothetical protein